MVLLQHNHDTYKHKSVVDIVLWWARVIVSTCCGRAPSTFLRQIWSRVGIFVGPDETQSVPRLADPGSPLTHNISSGGIENRGHHVVRSLHESLII